MRGVALLSVLAVAAIVCSDGGGADSNDAEAGSFWLDLLDQFPNTEETRYLVVMNDYARVREQFDINRPDEDASNDELEQYVVELMAAEGEAGKTEARGLAPSRLTSLNELPWDFDAWEQLVGFSFLDMDQDAEASAPDGMYYVLRGRFAAGDIGAAVRRDPEFGDALNERSYGGIAYYSQPVFRQDLEIPLQISAGHHFITDDRYIRWSGPTESPANIERMIDIASGDQQSLADVEAFQLLSQGLGRLDTFTAAFAADTDRMSLSWVANVLTGIDWTEAAFEAAKRELRDEPLMLPFEAFATGGGFDDEGPYLAVVAVHADAAAAEENADRLEDRIGEGTSLLRAEPWSELIDDTEISTDGRLLLAKLYTSDVGMWHDIAFSGESLLMFDDMLDE